MSNKGYVRLKNLRPGAIFETKDGIRAVKSEYKYSNEQWNESECILLDGGAFAHFKNKDMEWVREIKIN